MWRGYSDTALRLYLKIQFLRVLLEQAKNVNVILKTLKCYFSAWTKMNKENSHSNKVLACSEISMCPSLPNMPAFRCNKQLSSLLVAVQSDFKEPTYTILII
jgi:hypothetical protein